MSSGTELRVLDVPLAQLKAAGKGLDIVAAEPVRVGYLYQMALEVGDEAALREALEESEPARSIG